jgi:hypothetical protein
MPVISVRIGKALIDWSVFWIWELEFGLLAGWHFWCGGLHTWQGSACPQGGAVDGDDHHGRHGCPQVEVGGGLSHLLHQVSSHLTQGVRFAAAGKHQQLQNSLLVTFLENTWHREL